MSSKTSHRRAARNQKKKMLQAALAQPLPTDLDVAALAAELSKGRVK